MTERKARPPADNSVQDVISTIDGYNCGPIRALAQDPPQNSLDARHSGQTVTVTYRLLQRQNSAGDGLRLLTITDTGTSGLDGPVLSERELAEREQRLGQLVIKQGENWAAWEAMRYTKSGEDSLGSRGQGKYAYLFHSLHPPPGASDAPRHAWRVVMLYDTLLRSGEYRLGIRYHNPSTKVIEPPYVDSEARRIVGSAYNDDHFEIPLELEPLVEPGTRAIIPFVSTDTADAVENGELGHWLGTQWWRPIQKGDLVIKVVGKDGLERTVGIPRYWQGEPWAHGASGYLVKERLRLPSHSGACPREIKRLVLHHDETLANDDLDGPEQTNGVQLLRAGQWIVTLGVSDYSDWIPREHRAGFRGFAEFERRLEHELRDIERPAHDDFNRRMGVFREIRSVIAANVKEFAESQGWTEDDTAVADTESEDIVRELARLFVEPRPDTRPTPGGTVQWVCKVAAYYSGDAARLAWDDTVRIEATCTRRPAYLGEEVAFEAHLVRPGGSRTAVFRQIHQRLTGRVDAAETSALVDFGELRAEHPGAGRDSPFTEAGRYSVEVACVAAGEEVAKGRCSFYVACEPPPPPPRRPVTMQLKAFNNADRGRVIPQGGRLRWDTTVRNYGYEDVHGELVVSIDSISRVLVREHLTLDPALVGDQPQQFSRTGNATVTESGRGSTLPLYDGEHKIVASLEENGESLARATATIIVGEPPDPEPEGGDLPFKVVEKPDDPLLPRWLLRDSTADGGHVLEYSTANLIYRSIRSQRRPIDGSGRTPQEAYMVEIIAEGLVEWATVQLREEGDEGRLRLVADGARALSDELGDHFEDKIEHLKGALADPPEYGRHQRELAAMMLAASQPTPPA